MDTTISPRIPPEVVTWLEAVFPDTLPDADTPLPELYALIGEQRVIRSLREQLRRQNETLLEEPILPH